jgi:hypothetical protein
MFVGLRAYTSQKSPPQERKTQVLRNSFKKKKAVNLLVHIFGFVAKSRKIEGNISHIAATLLIYIRVSAYEVSILSCAVEVLLIKINIHVQSNMLEHQSF